MSDESVAEDPDLLPEEKETSINFTKTMDEARIYTEMRTLIRALINHPHFDVRKRRRREGDTVAVAGRLPISCLKVKGKPRSDGGALSSVVSNYADAAEQ